MSEASSNLLELPRNGAELRKELGGDGAFEIAALRTRVGWWLGIISGVVTIVTAIIADWRLAIMCGVVGVALIGAYLVSRAWRREFEQRVSRATDFYNSLAVIRAQERAESAAVAEALHSFIHHARDQACKHYREFSALVSQIQEIQDRGENGAASALFNNGKSGLKTSYLTLALERLVDVFAKLTPPDACVWTALRVVRYNPVSSRHEYVTLVRAGEVSSDRGDTSEPIAEDDGLPRELRQQHRSGHGIIIVNGSKRPDWWRPSHNDLRGDDQSIMAGPIFSKAVVPHELVMILTVNSRLPDVFSERHISYMKCCTDVLSLSESLSPGKISDIRRKDADVATTN